MDASGELDGVLAVALSWPDERHAECSVRIACPCCVARDHARREETMERDSAGYFTESDEHEDDRDWLVVDDDAGDDTDDDLPEDAGSDGTEAREG
jgi:hypothetical protein